MQLKKNSVRSLFECAAAQDAVSLGRCLSIVENGGVNARELGSYIERSDKHSQVIGITGVPGVGKSTLVSELALNYSGMGKQVAVLAVDPSSSISGGAFLGDRFRMNKDLLERGVFMRSLATRGHLGGISLAIPESVKLLEAVGYEVICVETVGVGQVEAEVAQIAETVVVVMSPIMGDGIQAAKAGLLELADVFVLNKADVPGVKESLRDLSFMLQMREQTAERWKVPIVLTVANKGENIDKLVSAIDDHHTWSKTYGEKDQELKRWWQVEQIVNRRCSGIFESLSASEFGQQMKKQIKDCNGSPVLIANEMLKTMADFILDDGSNGREGQLSNVSDMEV